MKSQISKAIKPITIEKSKKDYNNLVKINPTEKDLNRRIGSQFVDYHTFEKRLNTRVNLFNVTFYEFHNNPSFYLSQKRQILFNDQLHKNSSKGYCYDKCLYEFFRHFIGSCSSFRPIIAKYVYQKYQPKCVLDPFIGWGGRLIGALSIPELKYIGFDSNIDLQEHYNNIINDLSESDRVLINFEDSCEVDYSKYQYDIVLTSPPYICRKNKFIELYPHQPVFDFKKVMINIWNHLSADGHFCINVNTHMFSILEEILGEPIDKIDICNKHSNRSKLENIDKSREYIYVWKKPK